MSNVATSRCTTLCRDGSCHEDFAELAEHLATQSVHYSDFAYILCARVVTLPKSMETFILPAIKRLSESMMDAEAWKPSVHIAMLRHGFEHEVTLFLLERFVSELSIWDVLNLLKAVRRGEKRMFVEFAVTKGVDFNVKSLLATLTTEDDLGAVLGAGSVDINRMDEHGDTVLHVCAWSGRSGMVRILLDHGADPNIFNNKRKTPIHVAIECGKQELLVPMLASCGGRGAIGALHIACKSDNLRAVKLLLEHGADADVRDAKGRRAVEMARIPTIIKLLMTRVVAKDTCTDGFKK